jgi:predicted molibdopterin-dependent oxidoreductase YjgC
VGFIVSAQASNEEIYGVRRLGAALGATVGGIAWSPPDAFHDDFLIKADKNPNTQGLLRQGLESEAVGVERLIAGVDAGTVKALVLVRTDLTRWIDEPRARQALERVPYLVVLDSNGCEAAQYANVVLPIGTYAEGDGTFTNHAGRVQRFRQAVMPAGQAREGWSVLGDLLASVTGAPAPASAANVFEALAGEGGAFAGLDYERVGGHGAMAANARASA